MSQEGAWSGEKVNNIMKTKGKTENYGGKRKLNCLLPKLLLCVLDVFAMIYNVYR